MVIYIKKGTEQSGPYTLDQIQEQLAQGKLRPEDMACQEGMSNWVPLSQLISEAVGIPPTMTAPVPLGNSGSAEKPSLIDAPAPVENTSSAEKPSLIRRCFNLIFGIRPAFVAAVVVIILLVYWQSSRTEVTPATSKWVQYQNQQMGLEMRFPFTPQQKIKSADAGPFGKKKIVSLTSDTERGKKRFGVIVQNFEQRVGSSEFLYKILVKGLAKETNGKVKKEGPLKINGDSGWEFYLDGQDKGGTDIYIQGQIASRGKNIYTVFIRHVDPKPPKEAGFFFKSFKLTGSADGDGEGAQAPKPNDRVGSKEPGTVLWEFETGHWVFSSPAIGSDGTVYVGSWDGKLYAIKTDSKGLAKSSWPMRGQNARQTGRTK